MTVITRDRRQRVALRRGMLVVTAMMLTVAASGVWSHGGATGIVKERMDAMSDMSDKAKVVSSMFKGKTPFDASAVRVAADSFVLHGRTMLAGFPDTPASREGHKSEALAKIWQQWDDFSSRANEFTRVSEALQQIAAQSDDPAPLKTAFFKVAKRCTGCHKQYRKPRQ